MRVRTGMRVEAARRLTFVGMDVIPGDEDAPFYAVNPGEQGTLRSIFRNLDPTTFDAMGVEWDKLPNVVNAVDESDVVLV